MDILWSKDDDGYVWLGKDSVVMWLLGEAAVVDDDRTARALCDVADTLTNFASEA